MSAILGSVDADRGPPTTVPLRHLVVAFAFLVAGSGLGIANAMGLVPGRGDLAHVHLLFVGWIAITILGAMTQFVPVWSGTRLHSRRLANAQLVLVAVGVATFAVAFALTDWWLLLAGGIAMLAGLSVFAYNLGWTLASVDEWSVTERHFAFALVSFVALGTLGVLLAANYAAGVLSSDAAAALGVGHASVKGAHVTLAAFGAVLSTVYGALYQLAPMFTQAQPARADAVLRRVESFAHPAGVVVLATGRLLDAPLVARVGGVLVVLGAFAFAVTFGGHVARSRVDLGPLQQRYAVAAVALGAWAAATAPNWVGDPTAANALLGAPALGSTLLVVAVGFVVAGTCYHVVPFLVWLDRYSDRLGYEPVPMIDDLYSSRLARAELVLVLAALGPVLAATATPVPGVVLAVAAVLAAVGLLAFVANLVLVVHRHDARPLRAIVFGRLSRRTSPAGVDDGSEDRDRA